MKDDWFEPMGDGANEAKRLGIKPSAKYLEISEAALTYMRDRLRDEGLDCHQIVVAMAAPGGRTQDGREVLNYMMNYDPSDPLGVLAILKYTYEQTRKVVAGIATDAIAEALEDAAREFRAKRN
jgi:hypothetical protein